MPLAGPSHAPDRPEAGTTLSMSQARELRLIHARDRPEAGTALSMSQARELRLIKAIERGSVQGADAF